MFNRNRDTIVKEFKSRRAMARTVENMAGRGYRLKSQSGEFSHNPFVFRWNRRRVVAVFEREPGNGKTPPPGP